MSIFGLNPIYNANEDAIRDGRGFLAATGSIAVTSNNVLACKLINPIGSGKNVIIVNRIFGNNRAVTGDNLEYIAYSNPTITTLTNVVNGINLKAGEPNSLVEFSYQALNQSSLVMGGVQGSGEILPRGEIYNRKLDFILGEGDSLGFTINGAGNNLSQAVRFSVILEWYEQEI